MSSGVPTEAPKPSAGTPPSQVEAVGALCLELQRSAATWAGGDRACVVAALAASVASVVDLQRPFAASLRQQLVLETGLSPQMVQWGLAELGESFCETQLGLLAQHCEAPYATLVVPPRLTALVLSGNVFTAALRPIVMPLLAGGPVLVKLKHRTGALVRRWHACLSELGGGSDLPQKLAGSVGLAEFARDDGQAVEAVFRHADVVSAYGGDATMSALRRLVGNGTRLIEHGHGVSVGYVPQTALANAASAEGVARKLALDVAAYDQLGCLSPQAVFVQVQDGAALERFAQLLHRALTEVALWLPRGQVPGWARAEATRWRAVAAACGRLWVGDSHACSAEFGALRGSPGYRHVAVHRCAGPEELGRQLQGLGVRLKAVGVAADRDGCAQVARALGGGLRPRICAAGRMQTPPVHAYFDGQPPFSGMLQFVQIDP